MLFSSGKVNDTIKMQLNKKDHICFAFQKKKKKKKRTGLAFIVLSDHFLQQNKIQPLNIIEDHNVTGQHLITSQWSQPTFEK